MEDKVFVALDDWQLTCRHIDDLAAAITNLSSKPYAVETLVEELKTVAKLECADWVYVRQFGFSKRGEAETAYIAECKRRNVQF